jgi:hypothetical protein
MDRAGIVICLAGIAVGLVTLALGEHIPAGAHHLWINVAFSLFGLGILAGLVPLLIPCFGDLCLEPTARSRFPHGQASSV